MIHYNEYGLRTAEYWLWLKCGIAFLVRTSLAALLGWIVLLHASQGAAAEEISKTASSGPVSVTTTLSPSDPTIGDEVTLLIEVRAEKDVEVLMPEFEETLSGFRIAEYVPKERIDADGSQNFSQRYKFQTSMSGDQSIPPILVEFVDHRPGRQSTPDDYDAYEILTERIDFRVESVLPDDAQAELRPPLGELELPQRTVAGGWWIPLLALAGLVILAISVLLWKRRARRVRKQNAYEIAQSRLQSLLRDRNSPNPGLSIEQFFVEISAIIRRYLEDRFELRAPELTTDEFLQLAAGESRLTRDHQKLLGEFLKQADMVKFAGVSANDAEVEHSSRLAVQFLEETRGEAPDVEVPGGDQPPIGRSGAERSLKDGVSVSESEVSTRV